MHKLDEVEQEGYAGNDDEPYTTADVREGTSNLGGFYNTGNGGMTVAEIIRARFTNAERRQLRAQTAATAGLAAPWTHKHSPGGDRKNKAELMTLITNMPGKPPVMHLGARDNAVFSYDANWVKHRRAMNEGLFLPIPTFQLRDWLEDPFLESFVNVTKPSVDADSELSLQYNLVRALDVEVARLERAKVPDQDVDVVRAELYARSDELIQLLSDHFRGTFHLTFLIEHNKRIHPAPYKRIFREVPAWNLPFTSLMNTQYIHTLGIDEPTRRLYNSVLVWVSKNYRLTDGTMEGQLSRLKECWKIAEKALARKSYDYDEFEYRVRQMWFDNSSSGAIFNQAFHDLWSGNKGRPVTSPPQITRSNGERRYARNYLDVAMFMRTLSVNDPFVRITKSSDAGPTWRTGEGGKVVTRQDVLISDVITSNHLVDDILDMIEEHVHEYVSNNPTAFASDYGYDTPGMVWDQVDTRAEQICALLKEISVAKLKPKFEIIDATDYRTKVRNIMVFTSCMQLPLAKLLALFSTHMQKEYLTFRPSMYGWAPFHGGMDTLIKAMVDHAKSVDQVVVLFYSDNVYVYDPHEVELYSLDASKMEASSTEWEADHVLRFILDAMGVFHVPAYGRILQYLGSGFCHYTPVIFEDLATVFPGQSSGSQTTFINNHGRMASNAWLLQRYLNTTEGKQYLSGLTTGAVFDPPSDIGLTVQLKLTSTTRHPQTLALPETMLSCLPKYVDMNAALTSAPAGEIDETTFGAVVRADVLGFDAAIFFDATGKRVFTSCLTYERLIRSIVYRKTDMSGTDTSHLPGEYDLDKTTVANIINYGAMYSLYVAGGFAYKSTHQIMQLCFLHLFEQFQVSKAQLQSVYGPDAFQAAVMQLGDILAAYLSQTFEDAATNDTTAMLAKDFAKRMLSETMQPPSRRDAILKFHLGPERHTYVPATKARDARQRIIPLDEKRKRKRTDIHQAPRPGAKVNVLANTEESAMPADMQVDDLPSEDEEMTHQKRRTAEYAEYRDKVSQI